MNILMRLFTSSLGKKILMGPYGRRAFAFVIGHLSGTCRSPRAGIDQPVYWTLPPTTPEILWPSRIGLLAFVIIHLDFNLTDSRKSRGARHGL